MKSNKFRSLIFCFAIFFCTAFFLFDEAASSEDQEKNAVELQQKIELEKFYYGDSSDAKMPMMPMAIKFYNDAVKFYEKGEYDLARQSLKESLDLAPRNPLAYELFGEIENLQQNSEKAEEFYKKSFLLKPSPRLRQKIEQLQKENTVEKTLDTYHEEHFIIKYRQGEKGYEGYWLKNMLRDCYRQISQDFGYYLNHKTVVLFYNEDEFRDVTGQSHWVGGLYDGKIRLPAYRQGFKEQTLRMAATHEMTHAFVAIMSGMRAPVWIHEGLAEYEARKIQPRDTLFFDLALKNKKLLPIEQLLSEDAQLKNKDPQEIMLFYQESYQLVRYMVERYQMYRIKELLARFKEGKTAEEAIGDVFGISIRQLEKEWLASLTHS